MGTPFAPIHRLASRLPFALDDSEAINELYRQHRQNPDADGSEIIEIWTYCYIWRYFLWKQLQSDLWSVGDFEASVSEAFRRASTGRERVSASYASWVSVVCRNTFLTYARRTSALAHLDDRDTELLQTDDPTREVDPEILRQALLEAIGRLPGHLAECARLHYLENLDYQEMALVTGRTQATLRAYMHKALNRLRQDAWLREFREYLNDDFFEE